MTDEQFTILGFAGSLRRHSYNRGLLRAAQEVAPEGVDVRLFDLSSLPFYNAEVEADGDPEPVRDLKDHIRSANAVLIVTPEYNYAIPGVLKNAIDWASRPPSSPPLGRKPIAITGASSGRFGTVRAQLALRQTLAAFGGLVMIKPELLVSDAEQHFDAEGNLVDQAVRDRLHKLVAALVAWARRLESP